MKTSSQQQQQQQQQTAPPCQQRQGSCEGCCRHKEQPGVQRQAAEVQCSLLSPQQLAADASDLLQAMEQQLVQLSARLKVSR
jgi:hypothetical protein